jgi:hypothetical protein
MQPVCTQQAAATAHGTEQQSTAQGPALQHPLACPGTSVVKQVLFLLCFAGHLVKVVSISLMEFDMSVS